MSSGYKHLRCPGCDGTLTYKKEKKAWECIYCGNEIRREEEYDGLYTIKNVVRQVLVDLAYGRIDSAEKNLVDCEKISSDYVGTLIAQICLKVFILITPGACRQSEVKGILGQVKRLYNKLESVGDASVISAEEEALYESFDGNSDAIGVLVLVYDTLQAHSHLDFVLEIFDASTVYSKSLNANLLNYALKNNKTDMIDKVFSNSDNINCRDALIILLESYSDSEQKRQYILSLMRKADFRSDDYKKIEAYIVNSRDSIETKIVLYINAVEFGVAPSMQSVLDNILNTTNISEKQISDVYKAFCNTKPKDAELYELITEIYSKHKGITANFEMQELLSNNLYIKLSDKTVRCMINRKELTLEERIGLLEKAEKCKIDFKSNDAILAEVLLCNSESTEVRLALVRKVVEFVDTVSTNTLAEYIINCCVDGERKPEMLDELFRLNLNMSFFREIPNKYMKISKDSNETKKRVIQLLGEHGLSIEGDLLLEMACSARENDYLEKVACIQKSIQNGARINADYLSKYLETVSPQNYRGELMSLLSTSASIISDKALANYLLHSVEDFEVKLQNVQAFARMNGKTFGESRCEINHLGSKIVCNLFQGYVLSSEDSVAMVEAVVSVMKNANAKLSSAISVDGQSVKFKKYVSDNKERLSPITLQLCESNNVFSFFF